MGNKRTQVAASEPIIRTDKWLLKTSEQQRQWLQGTASLYRAYAAALHGVVFAHWPAIHAAVSPQAAVERLIHATDDNPHPRYAFFDRRFPKFPSYLRRAAIEFVIGQVSSFVSNYARWQSGQRSRRDALPPQRGAATEANPTLYRGQMIKFHDDYRTAEIKVWNGADWVWAKMAVVGHRERHLVSSNKQLSPALLLNGNKAKLAVPFRIRRIKFEAREAVCSVDLGINTTAVASIVSSDGTVVARKFIHPAADIDRRDKSLSQIRRKARQTGKLSKGFCKGLYAKARHRNLQIGRDVRQAIIAFAEAQGVTVIVFERLKHFRPTGGKKGSTLRQRFHFWLHRLIVRLVEMTAAERGWKVAYVNPRGTSKYAFDGSGEVKRDADNRSWATFASGKRYNCDLSASYNIGARFLTQQLVKRAGVARWQDLLPESHADCPGAKSDHEFRSGRGRSNKAAGRKPRTPVTLATLWLIARSREREAATTSAQAV